MCSKKLAVITLGCQMNKRDSEYISGMFSDEYTLTQKKEEADLLVVNTCSVRDKAEQKFFSLLGRLAPLKNKKKGMVIAVAGCVAQDYAETLFRRAPMVDLVFGPRAISRAPELLARFRETGQRQVDISDTGRFDDFPMMARQSRVSAWVSIMQGCNNNCSYCIVPRTRGQEVSRPAHFILDEIRQVADHGYKEITLLGQNVNSYGAGLQAKIDFPGLLEKVDALGAVDRVRFVTSHPRDLSDRLIDRMSDLPSVCPALHLPLQSGSDRILSLMNRGYSSGRYFERVEKLREKVSDIALTTDLIVGFPGETDEDFKKTVTAVKRVEYDNIFLFKYSPRHDTPATKMPGAVSSTVAGARFERIMSLQKQISERRVRQWIGREVEILVEGESRKDPSKQTGRTPQNTVVHFRSDIDYAESCIHVKIKQARQYSLEGELV